MTATGQLGAAVGSRCRESYERVSFCGAEADLAAAEDELRSVEAYVTLSRGRLLHVRYQADGVVQPDELDAFERAAVMFDELGDARGSAEAQFWIGLFHQVVRHDALAAWPALSRARAGAEAVGDAHLLSYVERHLGFLDQGAGRTADALSRFETSLRLRRELDFQPGVAAALLALAEFHREQGDPIRAAAYLDQARRVAESCGASTVLRWVDIVAAG